MIDGIILKKQPYQETSELLTILTRDIGKINVLSRGSLKPSSPLFTATQLYIFGSYDIHVRPGLSTMYKAEAKRLYTLSPDLYSQIGYAYIAELFLYCFEERIAIPELFDWVIEAYQLLNNAGNMYYVLTKTLFLFQKHIDDPFAYRICAHCHKTGITVSGFSFHNRGFICHECENELQYPIEKKLSRLIVALVKNETLSETQMQIEEWKILYTHFAHYYKESLGIAPKSGYVLKQL